VPPFLLTHCAADLPRRSAGQAAVVVDPQERHRPHMGGCQRLWQLRAAPRDLQALDHHPALGPGSCSVGILLPRAQGGVRALAAEPAVRQGLLQLDAGLPTPAAPLAALPWWQGMMAGSSAAGDNQGVWGLMMGDGGVQGELDCTWSGLRVTWVDEPINGLLHTCVGLRSGAVAAALITTLRWHAGSGAAAPHCRPYICCRLRAW
jgi:hypothetical protein